MSTHPTLQTSLPATSASSQRGVGRICESKKRYRSSTALQNMTCRIALNIGDIVSSCVPTQNGTILKATVVDFRNLLNRKCYSHRLSCVGPRIMLKRTVLYISLIHVSTVNNEIWISFDRNTDSKLQE